MPNLLKLLDLSHEGHLTSTGAIPENELRRKFSLGSKRIASLSPARDPFFTIVSRYRTRKTDDPEFKHIEEREIWHRRYGFIMDVTGNAFGTDNAAGTVAGGNHWVKATYDAMITAGATATIEITSDYDTKGRFSTNLLKTGSTIYDNVAAKPTHFFKNQVLNIPITKAVSVTGEIQATSHLVVQINSEPAAVTGHDGRVGFTAIILRHPGWTLASAEVVAIGTGRVGGEIDDGTTGDVLTPMRDMTAAPTVVTKRREDRVKIIGSSYEEASGLPNTSYTDKLHDTFGFTQIFKTDLTISNTALATYLKYRPNEYAHRWERTMLSHKRDITLAGFWSIQSKSDVDGKMKRTTQGLVDFVLNNGWVFSLDASKDYDGFLDDLSEFYHPEVAQENGHLFHVSTAVYNWFSRLGSNNFFNNTFTGKFEVAAGFSVMGMKKFGGFNIVELSTPHGTMRMVKDVNLDGTPVKILGVNYGETEYRPLVGNGLNRDTTVYLKVKDVAHTGDDFRTDLVQTEAGFEFGLGETFAMWT